MLNVKSLLTKLINSLGICETRTLLWSNSDDTSNFEPQTVLADLSGYDAVEIMYLDSITSGRRFLHSYRCTTNTNGMIRSFTMVSGSYTTMLQRQMKITSTGIQFYNGQWRGSNANTLSTGDDACVPVKIYGIKKIGGGTS